MKDSNSSKPLCGVKGSLFSGRAMCGHVTDGMEKCGLSDLACEHQVSAPEEADQPAEKQ